MTGALPLYPDYLRRQADRLIADLAATDHRRLQLLATEPLAALRDWPGITLQWERHTRAGTCSVNGWYDDRTQTIHLVTRGVSAERLNFTACHELGHHLQRHHPAVAQELFKYEPNDPDRKLEDRICDTFASRVLISDEALPDIHRLGPTAAEVIDVYNRTGASRAACVVRMADELPTEGWVILADTSGKVLFAAAAHHEYRLTRGTQQPPTSLITTAGKVGAQQGLESVTYRSGKQGPQFNTDAREHDGYVFAVMAHGATPWNPSPVPAGLRWPGPQEFECENPACAETFTRPEGTCQTCEGPICPACGRCRCVPGTEKRLCPGCYILRPPSELADGADRCIHCE